MNDEKFREMLKPQTVMGTAAHSDLMEKHLARTETWWNETTAAYAAAGYPYGTTIDDLVRWWKDSDEKKELERLRVENAALREIVEAVASHGMYTPMYPPGGPDGYRCDWCFASARKIDSIQHKPDCTTIRARALLRKSEEVQ